MLVLSQTTDKLQVVLGGTVTTNQMRCVSCWRDITTSAYTPGRTAVLTNNTTDADLVGSPAASTQRVVDFIAIYNKDTVTQTATIKLDDNGTEYELWQGSLQAGESVVYADGAGFKVYTAAGAEKVSDDTQIAGMNVVVLAADVVNNEAVANTIKDVTGLSFPVESGKKYDFVFRIVYTANATTTGSRWAINGPATPTLLGYHSRYPLTATTESFGYANAYDQPAASNASSLTTGNLAMLWGQITPSADGIVVARFASEVASAAITAKAGAICQWMKVL